MSSAAECAGTDTSVSSTEQLVSRGGRQVISWLFIENSSDCVAEVWLWLAMNRKVLCVLRLLQMFFGELVVFFHMKNEIWIIKRITLKVLLKERKLLFFYRAVKPFPDALKRYQHQSCAEDKRAWRQQQCPPWHHPGSRSSYVQDTGTGCNHSSFQGCFLHGCCSQHNAQT